MNNSRYLEAFELGRFDLMTRVGLARKAFQMRWVPVVGSIHCTYRASLTLFQHYRVQTRVVGWDGKWVYVAQEMLRGDRLCASLFTRTALIEKGKILPPAELLRHLGQGTVESPPLPPFVAVLNEGQDLKYQAAKEIAQGVQRDGS